MNPKIKAIGNTEKLKPRIEIDRSRLNRVRDAKCDIEVSWRFSPPGRHPHSDNLRAYTQRGWGGGVRAPGTYYAGTEAGAKPVFKNVGDMLCPSFKGISGYMLRVDGAGRTPETTKTYECRSLAPGETCTGTRVVAVIPPAVGGGEYYAYTSRLNWDSNQSNNTYRLNFTIRNQR